MGKTTRFGVSLNSDLLANFDAHCIKRGYGNRSEALRDLIRDALVQEEWAGEDGNMAATLTLVYDHHKSDLAQKMAELQHDAHHLIITTLHVHLDHHNCLEVLVLKGSGAELRMFSEKLLSTKGVLYGSFSSATTGKNLC